MRGVALLAVVGAAILYLNSHRRLSDPVEYVPMHEKVVALTLDDGPHPVFTPEVLQELDREHVKATFFMIGTQMEKYPEVVREVAARGHVIGNHTYTHPYDLGQESPAGIRAEIAKSERLTERLTGQRPRLFRPPRGRKEAVVLAIARKAGYRTVLWTVCADNEHAQTPAAMAQRVVDRLRPGSIILAHDGTIPARARDVEAVVLIIRGAKAKGYRLVTLPELLALGDRERRGASPPPRRAEATPRPARG